ncbi:MAG: GTPase [Pseudomonas profundi]|uniref:GTPase n=1 Tax=Pseudomonas profundi TaxID=1981513 RepID=UPI003001B23D
MFEQFNTLRTIFGQAKPLLCEYLNSERVEQFEQEIAQRTKDQQPVVMVYGVYNAGKSTLINALLGEERAPAGDVPLTALVSSYQIGDVSILDTPGIDAPIEHEKVTREQLSRSDAVVFVLSSDGVLEEQSTYEELGKIFLAEKPVVVVINNKSALQPNGQEYKALLNKFRTNLYAYFDQDERVLADLVNMQVYLVNAKAALKGKLEDKQELVDYSQLEGLTSAVQRLFQATNSAQIARTLSVQMQGFLREAIAIAVDDTKNDDLTRLRELILTIRESQDKLHSKVMNNAEKERPQLKSQLLLLMQSGDLMQVDPVIQNWFESRIDYFDKEVRRELGRIDSQAGDTAGNLSMSLSGRISGGPSEEDDDAGNGFRSLLVSLSEKGLKLGISEDKAAAGLIVLMKQGKNWFPKLFKGIGQKTMEKMAGKAVVFIGPAVDLIGAGRDYYKANEQERRTLEREKAKRELLNKAVINGVDCLYEELGERLEECLEDTFYPLHTGLQKNLDVLAAETGSQQANISVMQTLEYQLKHSLSQPGHAGVGQSGAVSASKEKAV